MMDDGSRSPLAPFRATQIDGVERMVALGAPLDTVLGGGLARGRLHEIFPRDRADSIVGIGFATILAIRLPGLVFWLRESGSGPGVLYPPGLAEIGLDPARLILASLPDQAALLKAVADTARCAGVGVVVADIRGNPRLLDLAATRRLALAAERTGATVLLLRPEAREEPSAARTRWGVAAAPSTPAGGMAPGFPTLTLELLRRRGGPPAGPWVMEWDRAETCLRLAGTGGSLPASVGADGTALPGHGLSTAAQRPDPPERRSA